MLCHTNHHSHFHHHHNHHNFNLITTFHHHNNHHLHLKPLTTTPKSCLKPPQNPNDNDNSKILRRHNSKSTSLLINTPNTLPCDQTKLNTLSQQEKDAILQLSLVRKQPPQFPGSIYTRPPHSNDLSTPPLDTLLGDDDDMLVRAVEIRRKVVFEIFVLVMIKKGRFGITYSKNLGDRIAGFIDLVMIKAAFIKNQVGFENLSFNARAKLVIEDSNVVPLVR